MHGTRLAVNPSGFGDRTAIPRRRRPARERGERRPLCRSLSWAPTSSTGRHGESYSSRAGSSGAVAEEGSSLFIFPGELRPGFGPFGVPGCRVLWPPAALEEGGGGVGKPGGGGGLWAAAVGGGDAAGRGRRGDMRWARHRAGERGSELISVGGGGGQRRRRRQRRRSRGRRGKAGARRRELLRVDRFHSRAR